MKHILLWILAAGLLIVCGSRAAGAHARRNESRSALTLVTQQATELVRWRHAAQDSSLPLRPEGGGQGLAGQGLTGKVSQALTRSGLASSVMQSLSPEAESSDKGLIRQHATLTLSGLSLPQVGAFLDAWRTGEPDWVVSGLDLSPAGTGTPGTGVAGADLPLRVVVTMDAVFKDQPRMPTKSPAAMHQGALR